MRLQFQQADMMDKDIITKYFDSRKPVGFIAGMVNRDDIQIIKFGEVERESKVPLTEDTIFEIGSISKTFTSILLGSLQMERMLNINDSITKFLPELQSNISIGKITLFDLATHTSGLPNHPLKITLYSLAPIYFPIKGPPHGAWSGFMKSDLLDYISKIKINNSPGMNWNYSNSGYGLLGLTLERITNSGFEDLVKKYVCKPLDMKDTRIDIEGAEGRFAIGHTKHRIKLDKSIAPALESAVGLRSSIADMVKFLNANMGKYETNLSRTMKYCQSTRKRVKPRLVHRFMTKYWLNLTFEEMALGWFVSKFKNKGEILYHAGGTPGFTSFIGMIPKEQSGVVILSNQLDPMLPRLGMRVLRSSK